MEQVPTERDVGTTGITKRDRSAPHLALRLRRERADGERTRTTMQYQTPVIAKVGVASQLVQFKPPNGTDTPNSQQPDLVASLLEAEE